MLKQGIIYDNAYNGRRWSFLCSLPLELKLIKSWDDKTMEITGIAAVAAEKLNASVVLSDAALVIAIGVIVVFMALIILTAIFWVFGKVAHRNSEAASSNTNDVQEVKQYAAQAAIPSAVKKQEGLSDEVVAVIAATVAAMAPEGKKYAIRSVRRARSERPVWAAAGVAENTRPF